MPVPRCPLARGLRPHGLPWGLRSTPGPGRPLADAHSCGRWHQIPLVSSLREGCCLARGMWGLLIMEQAAKNRVSVAGPGPTGDPLPLPCSSSGAGAGAQAGPWPAGGVTLNQLLPSLTS